MSAPSCRSCGRVLAVGETAYADDFTVLDVSGERAGWRMETRYLCEPCHDGDGAKAGAA